MRLPITISFGTSTKEGSIIKHKDGAMDRSLEEDFDSEPAENIEAAISMYDQLKAGTFYENQRKAGAKFLEDIKRKGSE
jgi:hypothetical protein